MLQVNYIRENREKVLERLSVRNFKQTEIVDEIIKLDEERKQTQTSLDNLSAIANSSARQIGELMRTGNKAEADKLKADKLSKEV
ncbi:MAG: Seryl-tRNA synthetase [Pedobacter sp.]|nr:Seryl-tRNA synthetase [Pedobacter sp.]